jgi:hypothetical protein
MQSSTQDDDVRMMLLSKKSERLRAQKCKIRPPPEFSCMHVGLSDTTSTTSTGLFTLLCLTARSHVSPSLCGNDRRHFASGRHPNPVRQDYGKPLFSAATAFVCLRGSTTNTTSILVTGARSKHRHLVLISRNGKTTHLFRRKRRREIGSSPMARAPSR